MSLGVNILINSYSILLLIVIFVHSRNSGEKGSLPYRLYMAVIKLTVLLLVMDVLSRFDGHPDTIFPVINHAANFLIFIMNPMLPTFWFSYVHYQVYHDEGKTRRLLFPLCALNIINTGIIILSQFNGWIYSIDSDNVYHRGPYFLISTVLIIALLLSAFAITIRNRKTLDKRYFYSLLLFGIPPCVGTILQIFIYGISFVLNSIVLSLLIVHLNIQNQSIYTDYLTGISNRKKFEAELMERIKASTENKTFSLVMLDFDNFKNINDTLGHITGDQALKISAELFKSCIGANGFISRIGGDEFCFILDYSNKTELKAAANRIKGCIDSYNASGCQPYKLDFSMGYDVYPYQSCMEAKQFIKYVDSLMYEEKKRKKQGFV